MTSNFICLKCSAATQNKVGSRDLAEAKAPENGNNVLLHKKGRQDRSLSLLSQNNNKIFNQQIKSICLYSSWG